jgi:hypothetical protein
LGGGGQQVSVQDSVELVERNEEVEDAEDGENDGSGEGERRSMGLLLVIGMDDIIAMEVEWSCENRKSEGDGRGLTTRTSKRYSSLVFLVVTSGFDKSRAAIELVDTSWLYGCDNGYSACITWGGGRQTMFKSTKGGPGTVAL